ncbi:hypothetical protein [Gorillibacterium sp. CAU 1737]|uniref:phage late control D family protein n=1 Tax=Gorillibacterium sp. CAU 1737 TaxID=3140362 RepID=UPI0032600109
MQIFYNSKDSTSILQPISVSTTDRSGGAPDDMAILLADPDGLLSTWSPKKGDTIRVLEGGYDTGIMYVDEVRQTAGYLNLAAISIPMTARTSRSQGWENVRFLEIAAEIAGRYGLEIKPYGVVNHLYPRLDQIERPDFEFLSWLCQLEGYSCKVSGSLVIYDEHKQEQERPGLTIRKNSMRSFEFCDRSTGIYSRCNVRGSTPTGMVEGSFSDGQMVGPTLSVTLPIGSQADADRWAKGMLRSWNKQRVTGKITIDLNPGLAAGSMITIEDTGFFDGLYLVDAVAHEFASNRSKLIVRRPLEGY